ncbi:hypothetical protein RSA36_05530 [Pantoea stewartii]|uniref:Uncharacterized protein n=1 Tax=Pantoea stewartii TaxID=66269 RepID=A0AB34VKC1_9GAMM|nr:hypothetical protein RSA30_06240 [Pantoea stewartii]KTT00940.1 hypothetical protein RSA13_00485 [Pantoea stewartii]KTT08458.1 hypothetical protein RSA36_05530 [Pantoea stewartii]
MLIPMASLSICGALFFLRRGKPFPLRKMLTDDKGNNAIQLRSNQLFSYIYTGNEKSIMIRPHLKLHVKRLIPPLFSLILKGNEAWLSVINIST